MTTFEAILIAAVIVLIVGVIVAAIRAHDNVYARGMKDGREAGARKFEADLREYAISTACAAASAADAAKAEAAAAEKERRLAENVALDGTTRVCTAMVAHDPDVWVWSVQIARMDTDGWVRWNRAEQCPNNVGYPSSKKAHKAGVIAEAGLKRMIEAAKDGCADPYFFNR